jgi:hypothetical protein
MNSELFYKKKMKKKRSFIIMNMGNKIRKTFRMQPIKIQPFHFENDVKCNNDVFFNENLHF